MIADARLAAEVGDLLRKLPQIADPNLKQAIQDRVDFLQVARAQAPVFGLEKAVTKGAKK